MIKEIIDLKNYLINFCSKKMFPGKLTSNSFFTILRKPFFLIQNLIKQKFTPKSIPFTKSYNNQEKLYFFFVDLCINSINKIKNPHSQKLIQPHYIYHIFSLQGFMGLVIVYILYVYK